MNKINIRRHLTNIEEIPNIARQIAKDKNVKAIYLFGSQVSGKTNHFSDIDLCIITDGNNDVSYPVTDNLDISFFDMLPLGIQYRVLKEGKQLIVKDKEFIYRVKIKTLKNYLDMRPLLNRYLLERFGCTI